jgi:hypothetical protein
MPSQPLYVLTYQSLGFERPMSMVPSTAATDAAPTQGYVNYIYPGGYPDFAQVYYRDGKGERKAYRERESRAALGGPLPLNGPYVGAAPPGVTMRTPALAQPDFAVANEGRGPMYATRKTTPKFGLSGMRSWLSKGQTGNQ